MNDVLKCQLKPVNEADYAVTVASQEPLRGTYLRLPLN